MRDVFIVGVAMTLTLLGAFCTSVITRLSLIHPKGQSREFFQLQDCFGLMVFCTRRLI